MQLPLPSNVRVSRSRLLVATAAAAGATLIALNPMTPNPDAPAVTHAAVLLTAGEDTTPAPLPEVTFSEFLTNTQTNLGLLESGATTADTQLSSASTELSTLLGGEVTKALANFNSGLQNAVDGYFYGGDDGYVLGLFPDPNGITEVVPPNPEFPVPENIGTIAEIEQALSSGNFEDAFNYYNLFTLETLDHTLQPLLAPLLDESHQGVTAYPLSIPVVLSQLQTNVLEEFGTYSQLKSFADATLAPEIGAFYGLTQDLDRIATELSSGDYTDALSNVNNLSSDVLNDLFNGFSSNSGSGEAAFTGLLTPGELATGATIPTNGSLLSDLLITYPEQLAAVLTQTVTETGSAPVATAAAESVSTLATDLFGGL